MSRQPPSASQQATISAQDQTFWQQWVEAAFPDLESRAYFLPPVYFNRVPMTKQLAAGLEVLVLHEARVQAGQSHQLPMIQSTGIKRAHQPPTVQDSDVRDDAVMQRIFFCLQKMSDENREVLVGLSQLQFGQYLGEPCYPAATAHLPVAKNSPAALSKYKEGDFDVLLIHRQYGIVVCEVKAFGDKIDECKMSPLKIDENIRSRLTQAVAQLDKAEAMLSHLVSDVTPGLRITKTIVLPNLTARQVQQAISGDTKLMRVLRQCLRTTDPADITGLCVCSDQLSDPKTPWDVSSDVLRELGNWWQRRVAVSGPDSHMTCDSYKTLVARFCGPATTVSVPCTSPPRVCVKTQEDAVSCTGECYTANIALFPEQVRLITMADPRVFVTGPPGTGKSVVLLLKAREWLRCGNAVHIVSFCVESRAACSMLHHLLLQIDKSHPTSMVSPVQPHFHDYNFFEEKDVEKALNDLSKAGKTGSLYVIADEIPMFLEDLQTFCVKLLTLLPDGYLHLWAACAYHRHHNAAPADWHVEYLTRPLRSPPVVVREVRQSEHFLKKSLLQYSERGVADHTDGPPVKRLYHRGQGHSGVCLDDCVTCGREVASFLHSLRVPVLTATSTASTTTMKNSREPPPCLQWRDVLVLAWDSKFHDQSGVVTALREANIPVQVMKVEDIEDVATPRSDVVWVGAVDFVQGLERKVIVCFVRGSNLDVDDSSLARLDVMSRCTSQLVIVSR